MSGIGLYCVTYFSYHSLFRAIEDTRENGGLPSPDTLPDTHTTSTLSKIITALINHDNKDLFPVSIRFLHLDIPNAVLSMFYNYNS